MAAIEKERSEPIGPGDHLNLRMNSWTGYRPHFAINLAAVGRRPRGIRRPLDGRFKVGRAGNLRCNGDLAHKMIFPALYAMVKRGALTVPVIGVAFPKWSLERLHRRATDSIRRSGGVDNKRALKQLLSLLKYVSGDYTNSSTFTAINRRLGARGVRRITWQFRRRSSPRSFKDSAPPTLPQMRA